MTTTAEPTVSASIADRAQFDCRDAYVATLADLAQSDHRIVGVVNDSVNSTKLDAFKKAFPDRLINVGIAEQDMVVVAAGLANGGRIPFVSAASCFLTARALEQIKADVAYSDHNVKLCGMSPGMAYGELGPTHHSIEDIAWLRAIDNITIIVPTDPIETAAALRWAATNGHRKVHIRADSELLVKQMRGEYRVKHEGLKPLFLQACALIRTIGDVSFEHVRREFNKDADRLSNLGMDEAEQMLKLDR